MEVENTTETGLNWKVRKSGTNNTTGYFGLTYGNKQFVTAGRGSSGNTPVLTSVDGKVWVQGDMSTPQTIYAMTWGNSLYVAVGEGGSILTSSNGTTWTPQSSGVSENLHGVAWENSMFVAVGDNTTILTSTDGITWTQASCSQISNLLSSVAWNGSHFVAAGFSGVVRSADGRKWTPIPSPSLLTTVVWNGSFFLAAGENGVSQSTDGKAWSKSISLGTSVSELCWTGSLFVSAQLAGQISTSADGKTWVTSKTIADCDLAGVTASSNTIVVTGLPDIICTASF